MTWRELAHLNAGFPRSLVGLPLRDGSGWLEVFAIHARNLNEFFAKKDFRGAYMKPHHLVAWAYTYVFDTEQASHRSRHRPVSSYFCECGSQFMGNGCRVDG